ncbi:MAG: FAD-dependent oxidoreductase, partial [Aristaeellaceae bacterium]
MLDSVWTEGVTLPSFPPLEGDGDTDVLVIGGGLAGLLCAYLLNRAGVDCMLIEADSLCRGVTRNTTA